DFLALGDDDLRGSPSEGQRVGPALRLFLRVHYLLRSDRVLLKETPEPAGNSVSLCGDTTSRWCPPCCLVIQMGTARNREILRKICPFYNLVHYAAALYLRPLFSSKPLPHRGFRINAPTAALFGTALAYT